MTTRRAQVPEYQRSYGFVTCGAACGEDGFIADFLHGKQVELCGSSDASGSGTIATTVAAFVQSSAQCATTVLNLSLQARIDFLLATHLPSQTRQLVEATDVSLRRAYAVVFRADLLDPAGEFPSQQDPSFIRDVMHLKARQ